MKSISPNPVQGSSKFRLAPRQNSLVKVKILKSAGRVVDTEYDGTLGAGNYILGWSLRPSALGVDYYPVVLHADTARGKVLVMKKWNRALAQGMGRLRLPHPSSTIPLGSTRS